MRTPTFTFSTVGHPARTLTEGCRLPLAGWQRRRFWHSLQLAWQERAISLGARELGRLLLRMLGNDGQLDPARPTLMRRLRCSLSTVDRWLDQLKKAALVDWDQRFQVRPMTPAAWNDGSQIEARSNQYRLNPQPYSSMKARAKKRRSERQIDAEMFGIAIKEEGTREQEEEEEEGGACAAGAATEIRNEAEDATEVELPIVEVTSTCRAVVPQVPRAPWVSIRGTLTEEAYASVSRDRQRWHLARMAQHEAQEAARLEAPALPLPPPHPEADVEPLTEQEIACLSLAEIGARRLATILGRSWRKGD